MDEAGVHPEKLELPDAVLPLTRRTAQVTDTIVQAALTRSRSLLRDAVEMDPTIQNKPGAIQALDACIQAHLGHLKC